MNSKELLVLSMHYCDRSMKGKTLLQKRLYFIDTYLKILLEEENLPSLNFIPYYYGPYSPLLNEDLLFLIEGGFISETSTKRENIDRQGNPRIRYDFVLTDKGEAKAKEFKDKYSSFHEALEAICHLLISKAGDDYQLLSWAAKTHFLLSRTDKPMIIENIKKEAQEKVHWNITEDQIAKAIKLLTEFKLVTTE